MKSFTIALAALALLSGAAYAGKEVCITRNVVANYVNGNGPFTTCYQDNKNREQREKPKECEHEPNPETK